LILVCDVFDTALRLRSLDIAAQSVNGMHLNPRSDTQYA